MEDGVRRVSALEAIPARSLKQISYARSGRWRGMGGNCRRCRTSQPRCWRDTRGSGPPAWRPSPTCQLGQVIRRQRPTHSHRRLPTHSAPAEYRGCRRDGGFSALALAARAGTPRWLEGEATRPPVTCAIPLGRSTPRLRWPQRDRTSIGIKALRTPGFGPLHCFQGFECRRLARPSPAAHAGS